MQLETKIDNIVAGDTSTIAGLSVLEIEVLCQRIRILEDQTKSLVRTNKTLISACATYRDFIDTLTNERDNLKEELNK